MFSFIIRNYSKKNIGIKSLNTRQWPAELFLCMIPSPLHPSKIPHFTKTVPLPLILLACRPEMVWTLLSFPQTIGGNHFDGDRILSNCNINCAFPTPDKCPSPNNNFHVIIQQKLHLKVYIELKSFFWRHFLGTHTSC